MPVDAVPNAITADVVAPAAAKPPGRLRLIEDQVSPHDAAPEALHREVKRRVIILDRVDQLLNSDLRVELFQNLPPQRLLRGLARLDLPAGELPAALEVSVAAGGREDFSVPVDDGGDDFYCFHFHQLLFNKAAAPAERFR